MASPSQELEELVTKQGANAVFDFIGGPGVHATTSGPPTMHVCYGRVQRVNAPDISAVGYGQRKKLAKQSACYKLLDIMAKKPFDMALPDSNSENDSKSSQFAPCNQQPRTYTNPIIE